MNSLFHSNQYFKDRKVSVKMAMSILAQEHIIVDEKDASIILDFLYLIAKSKMQSDPKLQKLTPTGNRTVKKGLKASNLVQNRPNQKVV